MFVAYNSAPSNRTMVSQMRWDVEVICLDRESPFDLP